MDRVVHVFSSGRFQRKGNTLYFQGENGSRYLPIENVHSIYVHGEVEFNKRFLEFLSENEILLHYFNHHGYYMGTFYPREHYNSGYVTLKQAEAYLNEQRRGHLAKLFVSGAITNLNKVLQYYHHRGKDLNDIIDKIKALQASDQASSNNISELMALEGNAHQLYYGAFDKIVENSGFQFEKRSRRPPENALNALISFGNSLMYTSVLAEIYKTHLDPRIGFLHTTNARRFSLNLDVSEIFKPVVVDRVIFTIVNKRLITPKNFQSLPGGLYMDEKARKVFVEQYDERLRAIIYHRKSRRNVSYRRLIRMELYKLEKHFINDETYEPFIAQW